MEPGGRGMPVSGDDQGMTFTCDNCGSHDLRVIHTWERELVFEKELPCTCGEAVDGTAATFTSTDLASYEEWGFLDEEHRWEWDGRPEEVDRERNTEQETEVFCQACCDAADEYDWEHVEGEACEI